MLSGVVFRALPEYTGLIAVAGLVQNSGPESRLYLTWGVAGGSSPWGSDRIPSDFCKLYMPR
jgi:hypothetical protein